MEYKSLEQQLFKWEGWQQDDVMALTFLEVELIVPVGEFPAGTKFEAASVDGQSSTLTLWDAEDNGHVFSLSMTVGDKMEVLQAHTGECECGHDHSDVN